MSKIGKARYWCGIGYPENMVPDWKEKLPDLLQIPFAYCVHDKDTDKNGDKRKEHIHLIIAFSNTTTSNHALNVLNVLSSDGKTAFSTCDAVIGIRNAYDYLIHDTDNARKAKKHQYSPSERITGNNFDIGSYEQLSIADKNRILKELCNMVVANKITNFMDLYCDVVTNYDDDYFEVLKCHNSMIQNVVKGSYHKVYCEELLKREKDKLD